MAGYKNKYINIRVTEEQRELIKQMAERYHMTVSEYVLFTCLNFQLSENTDKLLETVSKLEQSVKPARKGKRAAKQSTDAKSES